MQQILKRDLNMKENELRRTEAKLMKLNEDHDLLRHEDVKFTEDELEQKEMELVELEDTLVTRAETLKEEIQEIRDELGEL